MGEDYYLKPNDIFCIYHESNLQGYISCDLTNELLQVFLEGNIGYPTMIMVNNKEVYCGHNRLNKP